MINIVNKLFCNMAAKNKKSWLSKLFDKEDNTVAVSSVLIISIGLIAIILLSVPVFCLCVEAWFNHSVSSDIGGWAAYIGAVATILGICVGGKVGINYTDNKFPQQVSDCNIPNIEETEETEELIVE